MFSLYASNFSGYIEVLYRLKTVKALLFIWFSFNGCGFMYTLCFKKLSNWNFYKFKYICSREKE